MTEQEIAAVNAAKAKTPRTTASRSTKKSSVHDSADTVSKSAKKGQIGEIAAAITSKALTDADVFADELYSETFINRLQVKRKDIEALSFAQLQGKAKQKTAHILTSGTQLQLAGSTDTEAKIFPCEDWLLGDDDE